MQIRETEALREDIRKAQEEFRESIREAREEFRDDLAAIRTEFREEMVEMRAKHRELSAIVETMIPMINQNAEKFGRLSKKIDRVTDIRRKT